MRALSDIFARPLLLNGLAVTGIGSALLGNGIWDVISWVTLSATLLIPFGIWLAGKRKTGGRS